MLSSSSKELPIEIVIEILSRLPVKTLIRCTSVGKSWYSLIKSPNFITTHLNRSISHTKIDNNCNLVVMPRELDMFGGIYYFGNNDFAFLEHYNRLVYRYVDLDTLYMSKQLVGSCNGLLCLAYYPYPLVDILNPSIRKGKSLPCSIIVPQFGVYKLVVGFGYHPWTNDYKVVRICYFERNDLGDIPLPPEVEVYSLCTDSWRRIGGATVDFFAHRDSIAFVSGAINWMAKEYIHGNLRNSNIAKEYEFIISFDIGDEVFRKITLPVNCLDGHYVHPFLMNYKESLSLVVYFAYAEDAVERFYDIWVMREYGVAEAWSKQFTILLSASGVVQRPLGFTNSGKLIYEKGDRELVSFALDSFDLQSLQLQDLRIGKGQYVVDATYMESLVLLEERNVDLVEEN